jgi:hypothetical protein
MIYYVADAYFCTAPATPQATEQANPQATEQPHSGMCRLGLSLVYSLVTGPSFEGQRIGDRDIRNLGVNGWGLNPSQKALDPERLQETPMAVHSMEPTLAGATTTP